MTQTKLTAGRIKEFQLPSGKLQAFLRDTETQGLGVRATSGTKAFIFQSKLKDGTTIRRTIGDTRVWSIDDARAEARRLQTLIDRGIDPREQDRKQAEEKAQAEAARESERTEAERRRSYTLKALCGAYVSHLRSKGKGKSATDTQSIFRVHVIEAWPEIAALPARDITSHQVAAIIRKVRESGKERTAGILRNYLTAAYNAARKAPFDSGILSDLIQFEIDSNPAEIIPAIAVNRGDRTLSADELRTYMKELKDDETSQLLRVALYAGGQRMAQLVRAKVSDFDVETRTLRLLDPKGKRTMAREHLLPLGPKAVAIVESLVGARDQAEQRIFRVSERAAGDRVSEVSATMGGRAFDLKDLRRTCETMLASIGITKDIRAQLLSHGISGVQAAHYDRYEYMDEKRSALNLWEKRLDEIAVSKQAENHAQRSASA